MKKLYINSEKMVNKENRDEWVVLDLVEMIELILNQEPSIDYSLYTELFHEMEFEMERTIYSFDIEENDVSLLNKLLVYLDNLDTNIQWRLA